MKRNLRFLLLATTIVVGFVAVPINDISSQTLINKELKSSSNENGRVFQWVKQTYVVGRDTVCAAFDLNGKRITPNGFGKWGVGYVGEGIFSVWLKKKNKDGHHICTAYNTEGKCIISETLAELSGFYFYFVEHPIMSGLGVFQAESQNSEKKRVWSLYNTKGECLISKDEGFTTMLFIKEEDGLKYWLCYTEVDYKKVKEVIYDMSFKKVFPDNYKDISYHEDYGVWWCKSKYGDEEYTYSKDLRYYAPGYYDKYDMDKFNSSKKTNPYYDGPYSFSRVSTPSPSATYTSSNTSSSSSSSSSPSSSTNNSDILFQGTYYTDGNGVDFLGNYYRGPAGTYNIVVYKDHIVVNGRYCEDAYSDAWARKTGRYKADGYSWNHTTNSHGLHHDEFFQVDEKTKTITLFCRDMHPSGIPVTCHLKLTQGTYGGSNNQYQSTYQQPQYQNQYQQQNIYQQPTPTPQPQHRQQKDCSTCNGTGNCRTCNGKGWYTEMGIGGGNHDCPNCNRTGKCRWCNGTGKQK